MFCHIILLFLFTVSTLGDPKVHYDIAKAEQHFAEFIEKYDRHYASDEEYSRRFEIFKNRLEKINYWNKNYEATYEINQFADQDLSKLNSGYKPFRGNKTLLSLRTFSVKKEWIENAPESLDYRNYGLVTEVKDQRACNSCYIFSAIGNIEGRYAKRTGKLISLSEQQALDCVGNPCREGGDPFEVMRTLIHRPALMSEADFPYVAKKSDECEVDEIRVKVRVTGAFQIRTPNEEALKGALAHYGPLSVAMYAPDSIAHLKRHNKVVAPQDCYDGQMPNHAVLLVGYSTDKHGRPYWIIKNSWGKDWGMDGYFNLEMGYCSILLAGAYCANVKRA